MKAPALPKASTLTSRTAKITSALQSTASRLLSARAVLATLSLATLGFSHMAQAQTPPLPSAAYQANADIYDPRSKHHYPAVVNANALVMRVQMPKPSEMARLPGDAMVVVTDQGSGDAFMYPTGRLAPTEKLVMRASLEQASRFLGGITTDVRNFSGTPGKTRTLAAQSCRDWLLKDQAGTLPTVTVCLTEDGIPLSIVRQGESQPVYLVSELKRGPQPARLFVPPSGYQVLNAGGLTLPGLFGDSGGGSNLGNLLQNVDPSTLQQLLGQ